MADTITGLYDFTLPEVGASDDTWGTKLNANWQKMETLLAGVFPIGTPAQLGDQLFLKGGAAPTLAFVESDQVAPAGRYRMQGFDGKFYLQKALTGEFTTVEQLLHYDPALGFTFGKAIAAPLKIGSYYVGGMPDGTANADYLSAQTGDAITLRSGLATNGLASFRDSANTIVAGFDLAGAAAPSQTYTVITKEKGDAYFLRLSGTTAMSGMITAPAATFGSITIDVTDGWIERTAGSLVSNVVTGSIHLFYINDAEVARVEAAATAVTGNTLVTVTKGDARYGRLGAGGFVPITEGGTGAGDATTARTNLGANSATNLTTGTLPAARLGATAADTTWVLARTADATANAIGTYAFLTQAGTGTVVTWGVEYLGSSLRVSGVWSTNIADSDAVGQTATAVSGTWKALCGVPAHSGDNAGGLFLRIS